MNWKFWKQPAPPCHWQKEHQRAVHFADSLNASLKQMQATLDRRAEEIARLRRVLKFRERPASEQPTEAQILSALVVVDETTPVWRAVHRLLDLLERDQTAAVCLANQSSESRHYNAGRLAMCEDLRDALLQKWNEAQRQNSEAQR